jgi:hypothetical protein
MSGTYFTDINYDEKIKTDEKKSNAKKSESAIRMAKVKNLIHIRKKGRRGKSSLPNIVSLHNLLFTGPNSVV